MSKGKVWQRGCPSQLLRGWVVASEQKRKETTGGLGWEKGYHCTQSQFRLVSNALGCSPESGPPSTDKSRPATGLPDTSSCHFSAGTKSPKPCHKTHTQNDSDAHQRSDPQHRGWGFGWWHRSSSQPLSFGGRRVASPGRPEGHFQEAGCSWSHSVKREKNVEEEEK